MTGGAPVARCFRCGEPASETFGNTCLCEDCIPNGSEDDSAAASGGEDSETERQGDDEPRGPSVEEWADAAFDAPDPGRWPPAHTEWDQWMCRRETKQPFAPWGDRDAPVECEHETCVRHDEGEDDEATLAACDDCCRHRADEALTCAECRHDARYKWGYRGNHTDFETAREWAEKHPGLSDDLAFIQREDDPFAFIDGDDVRDPETGAMHPGVIDVLGRLGVSYADVSTSGGGAHVPYRGTLPEGVKSAEFAIDDEPFGSHDEGALPTVEIYDGKHVMVATGDHVHAPGSGGDVRPWDDDGLRDVLDEYDQLPDDDAAAPSAAFDDFDAADYTPSATGADETTDDIRDVFAAVDRLDARRVAAATIVSSWNDSVSTSAGHRAFYPTFGGPSNGTANIVNDDRWVDTGDRGGYGGPVHMAAIDAGLVDDRECPDAVRGATWFDAVDHLRDLGFDVPALADDATGGGGGDEDAEVFAAWRRAKCEGVLPEDDPIPHRALRYVAREHDLAAPEDLEDGWKLPLGAYIAALATVRDEYGLDPGRDHEHTAVLPAGVRDLTTAASGWDWRHAGREPTLTTADARDRTTEAIADAYESGDRVLVEALPTMGKSYSAIKAAADTDTPVSILTGRGRKEQYEQFREWCEEHGLTYKTLPAFTRDCDTANGEHGDEWAEKVLGWYRRGATPQAIHKWAADGDVLGRPLPCQAHEGESCPYAAQWDFDPDDYDVLIGHYAHAHKTKVTAGRVAVVDEFPDAYVTGLDDGLQGAISAWLSTVDAIPFDDYTDLLEHRDDDTRRSDALAWFVDENGRAAPDETLVFDDAAAHADAPPAVFTLLAGDDLGNGYEHAGLDDGGTGVHHRESGEVSLLRPPALDYARGVVALDGTPTPEMWELALGERLNHRPVLQDEERAAYITEALNLNLVRTTDAIKPYNSADHVAARQDAALLEEIANVHGVAPAVITSATAVAQYDSEGILDVDLATGEVHAGPASRVKWYGDVLGSNQFDDVRVGGVFGSNHYGDGYIKRWGAFAGETVERGDGKGAELSYGGFGDKVLTHMREHDTLQAAMRFGRDGNGAVVYVHTDTLPEWVPLAGEGRVVSTWSDGMRDVVDALEELTTATTADVVAHPAVDLSRQQVFDHLEALRERGVLQRKQDAADGRRVVWRDDGIHRLGEHGEVELAPVDREDLADDEVRQLARSSIYTWEFTNLPAEDVGPTGDAAPGRSAPTRSLVNGGDRPPDDRD